MYRMKFAAAMLLMLAFGIVSAAQEPLTGQTVRQAVFSADQLDQIAAPIALYPDGLLTQVMTAATYPLEIVEADRFMKANPGITRERLEAALDARDWDPSVKYLTAFPDLLSRMAENVDWTRDLGDAFLAQQSELLDSVQRLRQRAYEGGTLKTTEQQVVTVRDDRIIEIVPAATEVIYVPTYSPAVVYPRWSYPTYYYPTFYGFLGANFGNYNGLSFGIGFNWWWPWWSTPYWNWGGSSVFVNVNVFNWFGNHYHDNWGFEPLTATRTDGLAQWQHAPEHRRGVNYNSPEVAQQFGTGRTRFTREEARGIERRRQIREQQANGIRENGALRPGDQTAGTQLERQPATPPARDDRARLERERIDRQRTAPDRGKPAFPGRPENGTRVEPARPTPPVTERPRPAPAVERPKPAPRVEPPARRPEAVPERPAQSRGFERRPNAYSGSRDPSLDSASRDRGSRSRGTPPQQTRSRGGKPEEEDDRRRGNKPQ